VTNALDPFQFFGLVLMESGWLGVSFFAVRAAPDSDHRHDRQQR
jgi:hypothetical protein